MISLAVRLEFEVPIPETDEKSRWVVRIGDEVMNEHIRVEVVVQLEHLFHLPRLHVKSLDGLVVGGAIQILPIFVIGESCYGPTRNMHKTKQLFGYLELPCVSQFRNVPHSSFQLGSQSLINRAGDVPESNASSLVSCSNLGLRMEGNHHHQLVRPRMNAHPVYAFGYHLLRTTELDVGGPLFNIHTVCGL